MLDIVCSVLKSAYLDVLEYVNQHDVELYVSINSSPSSVKALKLNAIVIIPPPLIASRGGSIPSDVAAQLIP